MGTKHVYLHFFFATQIHQIFRFIFLQLFNISFYLAQHQIITKNSFRSLPSLWTKKKSEINPRQVLLNVISKMKCHSGNENNDMTFRDLSDSLSVHAIRTKLVGVGQFWILSADESIFHNLYDY